MAETEAAPITPAPVPGSFLGNLFNLYFEPTETFAKIFAKPRVWLAVLLQVALGVGFTTIWLQKVDAREFMKAQMEQNPQIQQMPAEQVERIIESQAKFMMSWARFAPFIIPLILDLLVAGVLMFVFRFFMAADVSFMQSFTTIAWTFAAIGVVQTPIMLAIFALKGDWNVDPNQIVQANPTIFFEVGDLPGWLWSLLGSLDLFSFWTIFMLAAGLAVAGRCGLSAGLWGVGTLWAIVIVIKVLFRLMMG